MQTKTNIKALQMSNHYEWYTPRKYIDLVCLAFGERIDLDPASSFLAQKQVDARRYCTIDDDGLKQDWSCTSLFLNPPYQRKTGLFVDKLTSEFLRGVVPQGIVLVNSNTQTKYYQKLCSISASICITDHRIKFISGDGTIQDKPPHGNTFFYLTNDPTPLKSQKFDNVFSNIGTILYPAHRWRSLNGH